MESQLPLLCCTIGTTFYNFPGTFVLQRLPFFAPLYIFYLFGNRAVDFFFSLRGFVFFWLYARSVESRKMSAGKFSMLRFSRLYPPHFATLIAVLVLQQTYRYLHSAFYFDQFNDLYHFILHLFFIQKWGLKKGPSFNSPVWSVSVEMMLYAIFCRVPGSD